MPISTCKYFYTEFLLLVFCCFLEVYDTQKRSNKQNIITLCQPSKVAKSSVQCVLEVLLHCTIQIPTCQQKKLFHHVHLARNAMEYILYLQMINSEIRRQVVWVPSIQQCTKDVIFTTIWWLGHETANNFTLLATCIHVHVCHTLNTINPYTPFNKWSPAQSLRSSFSG